MSDWGSTSLVSARVTLADGAVLEGELHLASRPSYPPGPETPIEMLNRADPFFALIPREGGVVFLPKAGVAVVACPEPSPWIDPDRVSAAKQLELAVELANGQEYRGHAVAELHPSRSRALDYVNAPGLFFGLWTDGIARYFNKAHVRCIRPYD